MKTMKSTLPLEVTSPLHMALSWTFPHVLSVNGMDFRNRRNHWVQPVTISWRGNKALFKKKKRSGLSKLTEWDSSLSKEILTPNTTVSPGSHCLLRKTTSCSCVWSHLFVVSFKHLPTRTKSMTRILWARSWGQILLLLSDSNPVPCSIP